jgi:hypothetical protein
VSRPLRIVGLMAVLALAGAGCAGSDGTSPGQAEAGAPLTTSAPDDPVSADTTPTEAEATCEAAAEQLAAVFQPAPDLPGAIEASADVAAVEATAVDAGKVLDQAVTYASATGQEEAQENLAVLAQMLDDVREALAASPDAPMAAYTPAYFEHGYAAAALRDLAATANLGPCAQVADLVVGADG